MPKKKVEFKTELNILQVVMEIASALLLVGMFAYVILNYADMPDSIPKSYDLMGEISHYGKKATVWFMPGFCVVAYAILTFMLAYPRVIRLPKAVCADHQIYMQNVIIYILCLLKLEMLALVAYIEYNIVNVTTVDPYITFMLQMTLIGTMVICAVRMLRVPKRFKGYYR